MFTSVAYSIITHILPTAYFEILHVYTDTFNNFSRNLALILEVFGNCNVVHIFFGAKARCACNTVIIIIIIIFQPEIVVCRNFVCISLFTGNLCFSVYRYQYYQV